MNLDWKKIGVFALIIGAAVLLVFFIYWFFWLPFFAPASTLPTEQTATTTIGQLPEAGAGNQQIAAQSGFLPQSPGQITASVPAVTKTAQGGLTAVSAIVKDPAYFSFMTSDGTISYYNSKDGKFYRVDSNGNITALSDQIFYNISNATWDSKGNKAILEYPDGSNTVYDFNTEKQITLPEHWEDFDFSANNEQILFKNMALDVENRFLVAANYDGSNPQILESIGGIENQVQPNWSPNNQVVATFNEGKDLNRSEIYLIGLNGENFKSMIVEGRGFQSEWSPNGERLLYSVHNMTDFKPQLWISDAHGDNIGTNRQALSLNTWPDKCSFAGNDTLYCAVPRDLPNGADIDRSVADTLTDDIYQIDLTTGQQTIIATPTRQGSIANIMYNASSPKSLFFTDGSNNRIYKIDLP
ncbi:MAG: hypothetical protein WCT16_00415 [Candidatus Buchananbacteria bacterium]